MEVNQLKTMEALIPSNAERPTRRANWDFYTKSFTKACNSTTYDMQADLEAEFARSVIPMQEVKNKVEGK